MRLSVLTLGPPLLVGAIYLLTFPASRGDTVAHGERQAAVALGVAGNRGDADDALTRACATTADELLPQLPSSCRVAIRPPFVLAGDLPEFELDRLHRETVLPVTAALWRCYFDKKPDQPVTIVALTSDDAYHAAAIRLDGYDPLAYAGYTQRDRRRIVLNLATGPGTLAHELAHILAAFDFPKMPEWFDEGLAALHEDATLSGDGLTMIGTSNWRSRLLLEALQNAELPALANVMAAPAFRGEGEGLNYAVVRCFCLYLQERGVLSHYYRKFRGACREDGSGVSTLCELLGRSTIAEVDHDFREWVARDASRSIRPSHAD